MAVEFVAIGRGLPGQYLEIVWVFSYTSNSSVLLHDTTHGLPGTAAQNSYSPKSLTPRPTTPYHPPQCLPWPSFLRADLDISDVGSSKHCMIMKSRLSQTPASDPWDIKNHPCMNVFFPGTFRRMLLSKKEFPFLLVFGRKWKEVGGS